MPRFLPRRISAGESHSLPNSMQTLRSVLGEGGTGRLTPSMLEKVV